MDFESRRNEGHRRSRPGAVIAKRVRAPLSSLGIMVLLAACAQAAVTTAAIPLTSSGVVHSAFGHPTTRSGSGQPSPTSSGHTSTPSATRTPAPAIDVNTVSPLKPSPRPSATPRPTPGPTPTPSPPPHSATSHVLVMMEENKGYK